MPAVRSARLHQVTDTPAGPSLSETLLGIGRDASRASLDDYARTAAQGADGLGRQAGAAAIDARPRIYASELLDGATCGPCSMVDGAEYETLERAMADYPTGTYRACEGGPRCRGTLVFVWPTEAPPTVDDVVRRPPPDLDPPPAGPAPEPEPDTPNARRRRQRAEERQAELEALERLVEEDGFTPEEVERYRKDVPRAKADLRTAAARARDESLQVLEQTEGAWIAPAPHLVRRVDPRTGRVSMVNPAGGEWDWFFALHPAEQKRLRRNMREGAVPPDVLADNWSEVFGGSDDVDAVMTEWLFHNRRAEAGNAVSLGRVPSPDNYGGLGPADLVDSPYDFDQVYAGVDDAIRHLAEVERNEAADYAGRAFRDKGTGFARPWDMTEEEWVAEFETFDEVARAIMAEAHDADEFSDGLDDEEREFLDRLEELVPDGLQDPDVPRTSRELYYAMLELARTAGLLT